MTQILRKMSVLEINWKKFLSMCKKEKEMGPMKEVMRNGQKNKHLTLNEVWEITESKTEKHYS